MYEAQYTPATNASPLEAIVDAIATVEGIDPTELPPIYDTIDGEAMNRLVGTTSNSEQLRLEFTVRDLRVVISGDGAITVFDQEKYRGATRTADSSETSTNGCNARQRPTSTD